MAAARAEKTNTTRPGRKLLSVFRGAASLVGVALAVTALTVDGAAAQAQDFPNRAIKIIVGPSPDVFSRIVAEHLKDAWGQPVVVEPRPGAGRQARRQ
jgi:tripartite-type tricarboxylate transporter receptor subunit TctC